MAVHLATVADTAREIDFAMRWGFGSQQGPFELWQAAGWKQVAEWIQEDIAAGKTLASAPLPAWVFEGPVAENGGVHSVTVPGAPRKASSRPVPSCRSMPARLSRNAWSAKAPSSL